MCWNIRKAVSRVDKRHVKELVHHFHPSVFIILETHIAFADVEEFWKKLGYMLVGIFEAHGRSIGIWVLEVVNSNACVWWILSIKRSPFM